MYSKRVHRLAYPSWPHLEQPSSVEKEISASSMLMNSFGRLFGHGGRFLGRGADSRTTNAPFP
jgi:hypothetical protein